MPGDSTVYQLTHLYHIFSEALDKQKDIRVVFCDISKAFDRVWHPGLLAKLHNVGIIGSLYDWFHSYLSDRVQRVVINGQCSTWAQINSGVPQGSVLGPLLFLVYINDITLVPKSSEVRLFADDTILYMFVENPVLNAEAFNHDLDLLTEWAHRWLINFSPHKTKSMIISRRKKPEFHPQLLMDDTPLDSVETHKHLGITFSTTLQWDDHIEQTATKASQCLDVINALKYKLDRKTLESLYFAFIRSKLEYANIVWDNCSRQLADLLESVQYRAAKIVSGAISRTSHHIVYSELGWDTLEERRCKSRLKTMYKVINKDAPEYLQSIIPATQGQHDYQLRHENNYPVVKTRTTAFKNTFLPKTIIDWNKLNDDTKLSESLESFSNKLNGNLTKTPIWYYTGDRNASILHARLRMLCSPLNDHLFSYIHVDSPSCVCGHPRENNKHFLLECPLYLNSRNLMIAELEAINFTPNAKHLLYGDETSSEDSNIKAFKIIQDYILETKRF